jgi:hypothetical protein
MDVVKYDWIDLAQICSVGGPCEQGNQWRAVHGSKGSIASVVKKRKEKNSYINN